MAHSLKVYMKSMLCIGLIGVAFTACSSGSKSTKPSPQKSALPQKEEIVSLGNGWYEVYGYASMHNITLETAREQAVGNACRTVIETHSGVEINARTFDFNSTDGGPGTFLSLSRQLSHGRILEKKILKSYVDNQHEEMVVFIKVKVGRQKGRPDSGFKLTARLNREIYHENDRMHLTATATKSCYIWVFNIVNDAVYVLFPNRYREDNRLNPGDTFHLPDQKEMQSGISFRLYLSKGSTRESGIVKIIATKERLSLWQGGELSRYGTYETGLEKLLISLITVSRDQMEEVDLLYAITR